MSLYLFSPSTPEEDLLACSSQVASQSKLSVSSNDVLERFSNSNGFAVLQLSDWTDTRRSQIVVLLGDFGKFLESF